MVYPQRATNTTFDLAAERANRGHSTNSLAIELGIHRASLAALERGESVHPATAKKIADYFEIKVTDLMPIDRSAA